MKWTLPLVMTLAVVPIWAQTSGGYPQVSAQAGTFFTAGSYDEIVYADSSSTSKLSQLVWPVPLSLGADVQFGVQWQPWLKTSLGLQATLPFSTGNMTDDDWDVNGDLYDADGDLLSRIHSDSKAYLTSDWALRAEVAFPFSSDGFQWWLSTGVEYQQRSWEAWNTTQTVTLADDGNTYTDSLQGLSIIFRQIWVLAYVGGGASVSFYGLLWSADVRVAPFPYAQQTDAHVLRELTFNETLTGGIFVGPSLSVSWPLSHTLAMKATAEYEGAFLLRGDEVLSNNGATSGTDGAGFYSYADGAGAGFQSFRIGVNLVARL